MLAWMQILWKLFTDFSYSSKMHQHKHFLRIFWKIIFLMCQLLTKYGQLFFDFGDSWTNSLVSGSPDLDIID